MLRSPEFFSARSFCAPQDKDYAATGAEGYSIPGKRGEVLKDEIAQEIVSELRLIREELQNLTMAVRSASTSRNSENSYRGKPPKFYPRRAANPPDVRHSQGHKPPRSPQRGEPRSQWHQNAPKALPVWMCSSRLHAIALKNNCRAGVLRQNLIHAPA